MQRHTIIPWQLSPIDERRAPKPTRRPTWKKCHRGQIINHMYSSGSIKERERGLLTPYLKKYPEGDKVVSYQKRGHLEMQTDPSYYYHFYFKKELIKTDSTSGGETIRENRSSHWRDIWAIKSNSFWLHTLELSQGIITYLYLGIRASFSSFVKCLGRKKNSNRI